MNGRSTISIQRRRLDAIMHTESAVSLHDGINLLFDRGVILGISLVEGGEQRLAIVSGKAFTDAGDQDICYCGSERLLLQRLLVSLARGMGSRAACGLSRGDECGEQ